MWKDYSAGYIKSNRASSVSIMVASLISTLFLSLLSSLFYNFWTYEIERIILEEGDWRGRIKPTPLIAFYLVVLVIVSLSLILIIRNSFAVSMNARIHQFGIFSSIGATPGQIRTCLMQEAATLCTVPTLLGSILGVSATTGVIQVANLIAKDIEGRHEASFHYHPLIFVITILASVLTVFFSAWMPAKKLSRLTPLEAIRNADISLLKSTRYSRIRILSRLFGLEGELAGNSLKMQRRALRTSTLSLTLSFLGFTMMLCFIALSDISTKHTYFDRYQDVWDVMVTIKNTKIEELNLKEELYKLEGEKDIIVYQKAMASIPVSKEWISDELAAIGGIEAVAGSSVSESDDTWPVKAPVVIMDDGSFIEYCEQIDVMPQMNGTIILNRIWDSINSNYRYKEYIPFVTENRESIVLQNTEKDQERVVIPVLGYTQQVPVLREEYTNYSLVQFMPLSLWKEISGQLESAEEDIYLRILDREGVTLEELNETEENVLQLIGTNYETESENRIQEKLSNDKMKQGYKLIIGSFCFLLALIGIANVFSYTLGFLHQRKREFARYMSVGLTPAGMRKIFAIEALMIAGRPLLITFPLTVAFEAFAIKASYLNPMEVLTEVPVIPILIFSLVIFWFVGLAYYIGGKRLLQCDLCEVLRNDC